MWPYLVAGVWGFFGVAMLAAGSHGPLAGGPISAAGQMLLFHGLALIAIAGQARLQGRLFSAAMILFAVGSGVFSALIALRATTGIYEFAFLVPVGGMLTLAGWVVFTLAVALSRREG